MWCSSLQVSPHENKGNDVFTTEKSIRRVQLNKFVVQKPFEMSGPMDDLLFLPGLFGQFCKDMEYAPAKTPKGEATKERGDGFSMD